MNLQPKSRASFFPSVDDGQSTVSEPRLRCDRTFCRYFALALQITLVSDNNDREIVLVLDSQYLLLKCPDLFERLSRGDAVDKKETFASSHVLFSHGRVLFLTGGIENIEEGNFFVDNTLLAVGVWSVC